MLKYQIQTDTFALIENSLIFMYEAFQRWHWYCVILAVNKQKKEWDIFPNGVGVNTMNITKEDRN